MPLQHDLYTSAQRWAAAALQAFAADPPDHDFAVHHMAVAVEHVSKSYLCSVTEVLLVGEKPTVDELLLLAGRSDKTNPQRLDLKTIGGAAAINRAEQVLGRRLPNADALRRLREARNGITHLGQGDDPTQARALLAAGIGYINQLLGELDVEPGVFWDSRMPLAVDLLARAVTDLELRYQHKLRRARQLFAQRFARMSEEARTAQIEILAGVPLLARWHMVSPAKCPACGSPAMVSGRDYLEDFGAYFAPRFFGCRVCELQLVEDELKLAGFEIQFLNEYDEEQYRDWEPDEDDLRRLVAAQDEYSTEPYEYRS
jgi:hypothetical protein